MPKMQRLRDIDLDIDKNKGALEYLFEERNEDGSFVLVDRDAIEEDQRITKFTDKLNQKWGKEESQLRTAIYISFVKDSETYLFRKKIKQARQSFMRQSIMSKKSTTSKYSINSRITPSSKSGGMASFRAGVNSNNSRTQPNQNDDAPLFGSKLFQSSDRLGSNLSRSVAPEDNEQTKHGA